MLWDRVFGTHQIERQVIYFGVVSPTPHTMDPFVLQFGFYKNIWQKFFTYEGFGNKISVLMKGPGWAPGKPRLGLLDDIPEPDPTEPKYNYDPYIAEWRKCYVFFQSAIFGFGFYILADNQFIVENNFFQFFISFIEYISKYICNSIIALFITQSNDRNIFYRSIIEVFLCHL